MLPDGFSDVVSSSKATRHQQNQTQKIEYQKEMNKRMLTTFILIAVPVTAFYAMCHGAVTAYRVGADPNNQEDGPTELELARASNEGMSHPWGDVY